MLNVPRISTFNPSLHRTTRAIARPETPAFEQFVQQTISEALKKLLSTRGLYQKEMCDLDPLIKALIVLPDPGPPVKREDIVSKLLKPPPGRTRMSISTAKQEASWRPWCPDTVEANSEETVAAPLAKDARQEIYSQQILFRLLNFPSECPQCGTSPFTVRRFAAPDVNCGFPIKTPKGLLQVWHLYCRCEGCRQFVNVFSVKRVGLQLMLVGRSERAVPPVHKLIPKDLRPAMIDAINASNENDVFGGMYHLRTFVEHYMKAAINEPVESKLDGESLCARYNTTLDPRMKLGMPSLTPVYSELSERIHARKGERADFYAALQTLHGHLEAKDMYARHKYDGPDKKTLDENGG